MKAYSLLILILLIDYGSSANCTASNPGCESCINSTNNCISCQFNYVLNDELCSQCQVGQYSQGGNSTTCLTCPLGCANCNQTVCLSCLANFGFNNGSCSTCEEGQIAEGGTEPCYKCPKGCQACSYINSSINCSSCSNNYYYLNGLCNLCSKQQYSPGGQSQCIPCPQGCEQCSSNQSSSTGESCSSCSANFTLSNGNCSACPVGQTSAGGQATQCCTIGCATCGNSTCTDCIPNFILNNNTCQACPSASYSDGDNATQCIECTPNCTSCNSSACISCQAGFLPYTQTSCMECGINYCSYCSSPNYCQSCNHNFSLSTISNTTQCNCNYPFELSSGSCICPSSFQFNGTNCICTIPQCVNCSASGECLLCLTGYAVLKGACIIQCQVQNCTSCNNLTQCVACNQGLVPSTYGLSCLLCNNITNCESCLTNNNCTICLPGFILTVINNTSLCVTCTVPNCIACSSNNVCYQCAAGYSNINNGSQCILCLSPCATCLPNGLCSSCQYPYYPIPFSNNTCFICNIANCNQCDTNNPNNCLKCAQYYSHDNTTNICQAICSNNCASCTNSTSCISCTAYYYVNSSGYCNICNNSPACLICNQTSPSLCLNCSIGFFLSNYSCLPCPIYCSSCTSASLCTSLISQYQLGYLLMPVNSSSNTIAICFSGCSICLPQNPMLCIDCFTGYYLNISTGQCLFCNIESNCMECSTESPSICLSCYPGSILIQNICQTCSYPCITCNFNSSSQCISCAADFTLVNNTCLKSTSFCGNDCASCVSKDYSFVCLLCNEGAVLSNGYCVPCQAGCGVCSNENISLCLFCAAGYYFNQTGGCSQCQTQNCMTCSPLGCTSCQNGYILNATLSCVLPCKLPCATCSWNDSSYCLACAFGHILTTIPFVNCLQMGNVTVLNGVYAYCPPGYGSINQNTMTQINQYCYSCGLLCVTCPSYSLRLNCTSCFNGSYLSNWTCVPCPIGCASCNSENVCFYCQQGFIPFASLQLIVSSTQPVLCIACLPPCSVCIGSISNCLSCITNFTLQGTQCVSYFNYQIQALCSADTATFNQNYLNFLTQIAQSINASISQIIVLSIVYGSTNLTLLINSQYSPGSNNAIQQQNILQKTFSSGNVGGIQIASFSITTNGGSNGNDDNNNNTPKKGLSKIWIIAISISVLIIIVIISSIIWYCIRQRNKEPQRGVEMVGSQRKSLLLSEYQDKINDQILI